jgi:endonuclease YncB( thermonuclease family)
LGTTAVVAIVMNKASEAKLEVGRALVFENYCHKGFCNEWKGIQERAKARKAGLWSHPEPVPPWEFRKQKP